MDSAAELPPAPVPSCEDCGRPLKPGALFCSHCGHRLGDPVRDRRALARARAERVRMQAAGWEGIRSLILIYAALLGAQALTFLISRAFDAFVTDVAGTALLAVIIVVAAIGNRDALKPCLRRPGFGPAGYALVLFASVPIVMVVSGYAHGLAHLFRLRLDSEREAFDGRGIAWAFLLTAVSPAIFEELGFRGVFFSLLGRSLEVREVILISAAAFGILHLSVPMLITHVPLGLYLGWLRQRSGSLYPSIVAHFLHNALVIAGQAWLPLPEWLR